MMLKNTGRRPRDWDKDVTWGEYKAALPATIEGLAAELGVSLRRAEKSVDILRRLNLIERRDDGLYHTVDQEV